jgi:glycoprotein endo-alpha-1,2-mannosidase
MILGIFSITFNWIGGNMRKVAFYVTLILLFTAACSNTSSGEINQNSSSSLTALTSTPAWPAVIGPNPSTRIAAFYYPWYFNLKVDGKWVHWDQGGYHPPQDIGSDFYPVLGAYSESDPAVLAQHFAWLRQAGVGVIISSWWGQGDATDRALPLMFDIADHYGLKIAFHIEPYGGRSATKLADDIHYIYAKYGDHPAFFWTTETSLFSKDDRPKGLFFLWATVNAANDASKIVATTYWQKTMDTLHKETPGVIFLTDQNDPIWITRNHFDGSYNYGVLDSDKVGYKWARSLPKGAWYVPGINPGFSAKRIGLPISVDTPRRDGSTYDDRWKSMFAVGIKPRMVAITTFNEWHEGTQIEPAAPKMITSNGSAYLDYGKLAPDEYLKMTREWVDKFLAYKW